MTGLIIDLTMAGLLGTVCIAHAIFVWISIPPPPK